MTKTEATVRALARAMWSDAVVETEGDAPALRVTIHGTEAPLRACMPQVREAGATASGAWRRALGTLRRLAKRKANAEAKRAEGMRAQAARHDAHAAAITAALNGDASGNNSGADASVGRR